MFRPKGGDGMTGTETNGAEAAPPNYTLCDLWTEFCQTTAIHGFNKISTPTCRFTFRGILWTLAVCGATGFLIFNLMSEIGDYYSYPIATKVTNKIRNTIEFPAVTICNRCTLNKTRLASYPDLESYFRDSSLQQKTSDIYNFDDIDDGIMLQPLSLDWWTNMSMDASSLFHLCFFGGESIDCSSNFLPVFTDEGLCHTFNFNASDIVNVKNSGSGANLIINYNIAQQYYTFRETHGGRDKDTALNGLLVLRTFNASLPSFRTPDDEADLASPLPDTDDEDLNMTTVPYNEL
ncbi:acid-sensing ion channel 5-like, partial [Haliotis rubra]|uniref:acid-sensing ion channel 5-like n=1 Tax=Haliotis rubra TaxID=36100 RepID=UPI001EE53A1A